MNAVNPVQSPLASGDHPAGVEPSMEEILASIRRIIADDQSFPGRQHADVPEPETGPAIAAADFVTGDEAMEVSRPPSPERAMPHQAVHAEDAAPENAGTPGRDDHAPQFATLDGPGLDLGAAPEVGRPGFVGEDLASALAEAIPHEPETNGAPSPRDETEAEDNLFSPAIDSSVATAFNTLAASRLVASSDELRGLVREMIRPLLKAWVDEHLPSVVERLVVAEIERIARGP